MSQEFVQDFIRKGGSTETIDRYVKGATGLLPIVSRETPNGRSTTDIFSSLLQDRTIVLSSGIDRESANLVIAQLMWLDSIDPNKDIHFFINSPGGLVSQGMAILDAMNYVRADVETTAIGQAASMASVLLAGGAPGKRRAFANTDIMLHQPSGGATGQESDIAVNAESIKATRHEMAARYALWMELNPYDPADLKLVNRLLERDNYLNATEAKALGLVDEVVYSMKPENELHPMKVKENRLTENLQEQALKNIFSRAAADDSDLSDHKKAVIAIIERRRALAASNDVRPKEGAPSPVADSGFAPVLANG